MFRVSNVMCQVGQGYISQRVRALTRLAFDRDKPRNWNVGLLPETQGYLGLLSESCVLQHQPFKNYKAGLIRWVGGWSKFPFLAFDSTLWDLGLRLCTGTWT